MRTMWSDFMLRGNALPDNTDADFEHWTAAVMYCFVKLNDVYTFTESRFCYVPCYRPCKAEADDRYAK